MADWMTAAQVAILDVLSAATLPDDAPVFEHVPDEQQPPVVIIGDITAEPAGGKDGGLDRLTVEILTLVRKPDRTELYALQAAVRDALEDAELVSEVAELSRPVFESSDDELLDDGETYLGTQRFSLFAQDSPYGPELVSNGSFADATGWTLSNAGGGAAPTIAGGKLNFVATTGVGLATIAAAHEVPADADMLVAGIASGWVGSDPIQIIVGAGLFDVPVSVSGDGSFRLTAHTNPGAAAQTIVVNQTSGSTIGSIDNLSVRQILP